MTLDSLEEIQSHPLPAGFVFRNIDPADLTPWYELQRESEPYLDIRDGLLEGQFESLELLSKRGFYIVNTDQIVGTGIAWWDPDVYGERWGQLRWIAIHPSFRGRSLSQALLSRLLIEIGTTDTKCYLETSADRISAIRLYQSFGFRPKYSSDQGRTVWEGISESLQDDI